MTTSLSHLARRGAQILWSSTMRPSVSRELRRCLLEGRTNFDLPIPTAGIMRDLLADVMVARRAYERLPSAQAPGRGIAVVMPAHNHSSYIGDALDALARQTRKPDHVVVVDDCSKDGDRLASVASSFRNALPIEYVRSDARLTAGGARRLGTSRTDAELIAFTDADDISHVGRLEVAEKFFRDRSDALVLLHDYVPFARDAWKGDPRDPLGPLERYGLVGADEVWEEALYLAASQNFTPASAMPAALFCRDGLRFGALDGQRIHNGSPICRRLALQAHDWRTFQECKFARGAEDYEWLMIATLALRATFKLAAPLMYYRQGSSAPRC